MGAVEEKDREDGQKVVGSRLSKMKAVGEDGSLTNAEFVNQEEFVEQNIAWRHRR